MFRDNVNGQVLHFDLVGLNGSNFVMRDRQTHSEWQQATGEAIAGPLKGTRLEVLPFVVTTWEEWRTKYPQTLALVPDPAYKDTNAWAVACRRLEVAPYRLEEPQDRRLPAHPRRS